MSITLRQLEIFIAVAETAQVTKASKKLFVTQSAVSMALAELENQLGGSLFDRHGRSLLLNARGRYLLPLAKEITAQVSNIESIMSERNDTLTGHIDVVASTTLGNYILPYLIGAFCRAHPKVHINLLVHNTANAERLVAEGMSDVGYIEGILGEDTQSLKVRPWFMDELVVICGSTDPLAHNEYFDIATDFENKKWIMREKGSGTHATFNEKMRGHLDRINVVMEMGHPEAIKRAVESGSGISCMSTLAVCRETEHGWLKALPVRGLDMKRQLRIIMRKDKEISDELSEFLTFCDVMTSCTEDRVCLSSPWKLQVLLARHSAQKKS